ncbi:MAG: class IV adenylate cyclase [Candidatus Hydrothermarchaeaceae archaeon]
MLEIEAKATIENKEEMEQRILDAGGKYIRTETQRDIYFAHPSQDFVKTDEALRIRTAGKEHTLTYKGPKLDELTKTREEVETKLEDAASMAEILKRLGFTEVAPVIKTRSHYMLGDYLVAIDEVDGLGHFIEVEKHADSYRPEELVELLKSLGIEESKMERKSYLELLLEKLDLDLRPDVN